jgi:hypothetical protein
MLFKAPRSALNVDASEDQHRKQPVPALQLPVPQRLEPQARLRRVRSADILPLAPMKADAASARSTGAVNAEKGPRPTVPFGNMLDPR